MSTRYKKGRDFEYLITRKLRDKGYYVCRAAGSRGEFDLLAVKNGIPLGIQCKVGKSVSGTTMERLYRTGKKYGITACIARRTGRAKYSLFCLPDMTEIEL